MKDHHYSARIIADSFNWTRLTTMVVTFPRIVLAEFNTHRVFSRNSASSRAIPVEKMIAMVMEDPYIPFEWGTNQKGMQAGKPLGPDESQQAEANWLIARDAAVRQARELLDIGVHKQLTNRLLEPFMWHTVIVTATEWSNFFHLRCHPDAHPDIRRVAENMRTAMEQSTPQAVEEWHLPFISDEDKSLTIEEQIKVSVGRCARVSYLTHEGKRDPAADIALHDRLLRAGHLSPFEHVAYKVSIVPPSPFVGWAQYRKIIPGEADILAPDITGR